MMVTKVQKWGNSQGLRLSRHVLDLAELVARIPRRYKTREVDYGPAVGKEE
jgi:antitoxin component of MazEF toxin-antitoxin module